MKKCERDWCGWSEQESVSNRSCDYVIESARCAIGQRGWQKAPSSSMAAGKKNLPNVKVSTQEGVGWEGPAINHHDPTPFLLFDRRNDQVVTTCGSWQHILRDTLDLAADYIYVPLAHDERKGAGLMTHRPSCQQGANRCLSSVVTNAMPKGSR